MIDFELACGEYLADVAAAKVTGFEAVVDVPDAVLLSESATHTAKVFTLL